MTEQQLEHDLGVGRIVLGATRREGAAIASDGGGLYREQDEEVVLEQRRDDWPLGELDADRDRGTGETLA